MKKATFLLILGLLLVGCHPKEQTIVIISTSDIHGAIDSIPRLATMVKEYRAQDTATIVLVDMGDRWTGNAYVDGAQKSGQPIIELMNDIRYDVVTFGNHEFDRGQQILADRTAEGNFTPILANIEVENSPLPQPAPYVIMDIDGTKIAFVAVLTNYVNGHPDGNAPSFEGLQFSDPIAAAKNTGNLHNNADVVVAMTHIGDDYDAELAQALPSYFDIILGGHSHVLRDTIINGTLLGHANSELQYVGVTTIRLKGNKIKSIDYEYIPLNTFANDEAMQARVTEFQNNPVLKEKIGSLTEPMTRNGGEVNFFSDIIREALNAEIGLYHIGGVRIKAGVKAGDVERHTIFEMEPFASRSVRLTMTLEEIKALILNTFNANPNKTGSPDIYPSGMTYTIITDEAGRGTDVEFKGIDTDLTKSHSVAVADYIFNNYKFTPAPQQPAQGDYSPLLTDLFEAFLAKHPNFKPDNKVRIDVREGKAITNETPAKRTTRQPHISKKQQNRSKR